ncbi:MAG: ABC transporter ATP-binding protein [candidate division Zixibacteria bacterium]|nr:ABC transporter ATP-binding protein [candidate division Zixibacteria bacterium]
MPPILEVKRLQKRYGKFDALRGLDLILSGPGVYGFLGPNGAGKTTTIKLIAGLLNPTAGSMKIAGIDVATDPVGAHRQLGIMMETPAFYNQLTGRENLQLFARLCGLNDGSSVDRLLARVGLKSKSDDRVASYSRGMRQRLGLAAALLGDPRLVILDEPMNGLDPAGIVEMREWLAQMARQEGRAVLMSSHQMGEMERICDSFTIINRGAVVASGAAAELTQSRTTVSVRVPDSETAANVLRAMPGISGVEIVGSDRLRAESGECSTADVNRCLVNHNIDVLEITTSTESLEEIFFRLVGRSSDVA